MTYTTIKYIFSITSDDIMQRLIRNLSVNHYEQALQVYPQYYFSYDYGRKEKVKRQYALINLKKPTRENLHPQVNKIEKNYYKNNKLYTCQLLTIRNLTSEVSLIINNLIFYHLLDQYEYIFQSYVQYVFTRSFGANWEDRWR